MYYQYQNICYKAYNQEWTNLSIIYMIVSIT